MTGIKSPLDPQYADDGVSELQESIAELCEKAGIPDEVWNEAVRLIWQYENGHWTPPEPAPLGWDIRHGPLPQFIKDRLANKAPVSREDEDGASPEDLARRDVAKAFAKHGPAIEAILRERFAVSREDVLEEAARVAEGKYDESYFDGAFSRAGWAIAADIRALKQSSTPSVSEPRG